MTPRNILIISDGHLCCNPRVVKEASTLASAGHIVTLLTVRNHVRNEEHDMAMLRNAPYKREAIDMLPGFDTPGAIVLSRRLSLWLSRKAARFLKNHGASALGPAGPLLRRARQMPSDLVIVHNETAHWVGTTLLHDGRRVAADFEDWHSEDLLPEQSRRRPLGFIRNVERILLNEAVYTTTTSNAMADALHVRYGGRRPHVLTNSFPIQPDPRRDGPGKPPSFFWFSQTIGPGRGLERFLEAWSLTENPSRVVILGEPSRDYPHCLLSRLPPHKIPNLSILAPVPPPELPSVIARHDVGLALEESIPANRNLTITNKILQYLNAGLAVIATGTAGQREVLGRMPKAGVFINMHGARNFADTLDALVADPAALLHHQKAARQLAESTYCWEREAPRLLDLVAKTLNDKS